MVTERFILYRERAHFYVDSLESLELLALMYQSIALALYALLERDKTSEH